MNVINLKGLIVLAISFGIALSSGPRSPQEPPLEPIRVGVFLDLSGQTSSFGRATLNGIKLAASELNANGGKRYIELIVEDDSGRPYQAATVVQRLIGQKKVHALIGDVISSNSLAAAQHYKGEQPDTFAALGYDALKLLAHAVERAGTTDGPAVREALARTINFEGATGGITMDEKRNAPRAVILRLQDGKYIYCQSVLAQ
jgi:ABC-type branched-subunit amino acid transport system substrate-binding protein